MPFVAFMILKEIVPEGPEHYILNYFWLQVPQGSVRKHEEKWSEHACKVRCLNQTGVRTPTDVRGSCRSKRIREQMGNQRLHLLDVPSARKDPYACSCQTLGKWFPDNTSSIVKTMKERTAQSSPKDSVL